MGEHLRTKMSSSFAHNISCSRLSHASTHKTAYALQISENKSKSPTSITNLR